MSATTVSRRASKRLRECNDVDYDEDASRAACHAKQQFLAPLVKVPLRLSAADMAAAKADVYALCSQKRKNGAWGKCPKCILDPLIERMMHMSKATKNDVFLDVGSGMGNVCESWATRVGCQTIGVELVKENYALGVEAAPRFQEFRENNGLDAPRVDYIQGDIKKHWDSIAEDATIVWIANKCFPVSLDCFMVDAILDLKPGTRIFTMKDLVLHTRPEDSLQSELCQYFTFDELPWGAGDVEWTNKPGMIHMYTRTSLLRDDDEVLSQGLSSNEDLSRSTAASSLPSEELSLQSLNSNFSVAE